MGHPLGLYLRRRVGVQLPLGYASGLPYLLVGETLFAWMTTEGVNVKTIGVFVLCGLAYNLKLVWAPLLDRYPLPLLGRRRGWMLLFQLLLVGAIAALSNAHPREDLRHTAALAALVAFLAASQDIVVDAYKVDVLRPEERAPGVAIFNLGYRLGMLAAGGLGPMAEHVFGWHGVYRGLAFSMVIGMVATLLAPEPETAISRPKNIIEAYVRPIVEFSRRDGALIVFAFVILFRFSYLMTQPMNGPFLLKLGFTTYDLGFWRKVVGLVATLVGGLFAGPAVARLGVFRSLLIFGAAQALIHLSWVALVFTGPQPWMLAIAIAVENFFIGLAVTAFDAYLISLANASYSATQFAALTSLSSLGGRLLGASSGALATALGWPLFFGGTSVLAIPALLLVRHLPRADVATDAQEAAATAPASSEPPVAKST